jgi:hypothetical protein
VLRAISPDAIEGGSHGHQEGGEEGQEGREEAGQEGRQEEEVSKPPQAKFS